MTMMMINDLSLYAVPFVSIICIMGSWSHCTLERSVLTYITSIFNEENANLQQPAVLLCTEMVGLQGINCENKQPEALIHKLAN